VYPTRTSPTKPVDPDLEQPARVLPLSKLPRWAQWIVLIGASALFAALLRAAGLPGALLLGPTAAGIVVELAGGTVRPPRPAFLTAQAIIGCMIAGIMTAAIAGTVLAHGPLFIAVVASAIALSGLLGFAMSKLAILPGTTAVWGLSPGAAITMILMADSFGADARLVAFMQYSRLLLVALVASIVARFWIGTAGGVSAGTIWFAPIHWLPFGETLAIAVVGAWIGRRIKLPTGTLLGPMILGAALHAGGLVTIEPPQWLLAASYAVLGWNIGLSFTREILVHAARALPQTLLAILTMIVFCGGLAFALTTLVGIDPLTAYLATSPGGMDSVAIIAASSNADLSFIMALQTMRFVLVLLIGPPMSRYIARRLATAS
jgi:membrane AbrB-like protein